MRKIVFAMAALAAIVLCPACEKDDVKKETMDFDGKYVGTVTVSGSNVETFVDEGVEWQLTAGEDELLTLKMNKTKFAQRMPMLDMEVRHLPFGGNALDKPDFSVKYSTVTPVIPYYNGEQMPEYSMSGFRLDADASQLEVSFVCIGLQVNYTGTAKK